jgi:hypothetical protein
LDREKLLIEKHRQEMRSGKVKGISHQKMIAALKANLRSYSENIS